MTDINRIVSFRMVDDQLIINTYFLEYSIDLPNHTAHYNTSPSSSMHVWKS